MKETEPTHASQTRTHGCYAGRAITGLGFVSTYVSTENLKTKNKPLID